MGEDLLSQEGQGNAAAFFHVRTILGVIASLAMARILTGLARFVQSRNRKEIYIIHILWAISLFIFVMHFWWFEFILGRIERWPFEFYTFIILFAALHFFISALLLPDKLDEGETYEQYFHRQRAWFFALFVLLLAFDTVDSLLKGQAYFAMLGWPYLMRQALFVLIALIAIWTDNRRFHLFAVIFVLAAQLWWVSARYAILV